MAEKKKKLWEKVLMGAVIGGAIGSVIGGTVGKSETKEVKEELKEVFEQTVKPTRGFFRLILGMFKGKKTEEVKKIPHEDVK